MNSISDRKLNFTGTMAIDLGVTNLATVVTTNKTATIYDGKVLVSRLRLFSKKKKTITKCYH